MEKRRVKGHKDYIFTSRLHLEIIQTHSLAKKVNTSQVVIITLILQKITNLV